MNLYNNDGYLDIPKIRQLQHEKKLPFCFIWGGRGTGKTYGILKDYYETDTRFVLLRRTQTQIDIVMNEQYSPWKPINEDLGCNITSKPVTKNQYGFYDQGPDPEADARFIGYGMALSTISNLRGFSGSDITDIFYDEFIPERHERPIKFEAEALLNAYETINRNRELKGKDPVYMLCAANSNDLANVYFIELNLVTIATRLYESGNDIYIDNERGILLVNVTHSPISARKKDTALYRLSGESAFSKMSLENDFSKEEIGRIKSERLSEYKPVVTVGELTVYKSKHRNEYYCSTHRSGSVPVYGSGKMDLKRFQKVYYWLWHSYLDNRVIFENYLTQRLFEMYFT